MPKGHEGPWPAMQIFKAEGGVRPVLLSFVTKDTASSPLYVHRPPLFGLVAAWGLGHIIVASFFY